MVWECLVFFKSVWMRKNWSSKIDWSHQCSKQGQWKKNVTCSYAYSISPLWGVYIMSMENPWKNNGWWLGVPHDSGHLHLNMLPLKLSFVRDFPLPCLITGGYIAWVWLCFYHTARCDYGFIPSRISRVSPTTMGVIYIYNPLTDWGEPTSRGNVLLLNGRYRWYWFKLAPRGQPVHICALWPVDWFTPCWWFLPDVPCIEIFISLYLTITGFCRS